MFLPIFCFLVAFLDWLNGFSRRNIEQCQYTTNTFCDFTPPEKAVRDCRKIGELRKGFCHLSSGKRAKSTSVKATWTPCLTARAARRTPGSGLVTAWPALSIS